MLLTAIAISAILVTATAEEMELASEKLASYIVEGWRLYDNDEYLEAEETFDKAAAIDPREMDVWTGLGWTRFRQGLIAPAHEAFLTALEIDENDTDVLCGLGFIHYSRREYRKAEQYWRRITPIPPAALFGLTQLYLIQERFNDALPWAKELVTRQPNDRVARRILQAMRAKRLDPGLRALIEPDPPVFMSKETQGGVAVDRAGGISKSGESLPQGGQEKPKRNRRAQRSRILLPSWQPTRICKTAFSCRSRSESKRSGVTRWYCALPVRGWRN